MTSGREITPPPGFLTVPTTTTMFATTTLENMPLGYRASTSTNPIPVISLTLMEGKYESLQSLLRDRQRQMRNNDLRTKLEYFTKDYDDEREMEPRPEPVRAVTPPLRAASPRVYKRREKVVGVEETKTEGKAWSKETTKVEGLQNKHQEGMEVKIWIYAYACIPPPTTCKFCQWTAYGLPSTISNGKSPIGEASKISHNEGTYPRPSQTPMYAFPNIPTYANPNPTGLFLNPLGLVTPFIYWIEDYPLPNELKMSSYIASYDRKGDPDNLLHLFEGAIRMQKWLMQ
nr:hypothetical protein [Tanacetum cinerariifolium]